MYAQALKRRELGGIFKSNFLYCTKQIIPILKKIIYVFIYV